uniref:Chemosensory protein 2 n=1 Tax=Dendroctonus adjunctus TaxID=77157 RepID=A0A7T3UZT8_9CUCU|nr:chemosensory protein 2 [Dendroctonus adjunctus]
MKFCGVLVLLLQIAVCLCQTYTSRFDTINIDEILSNKRVLNNYVRCVLDEGPCTAEGRELRTHIPEALRTNCAKCTPSQQKFVRKGANFLIKNDPNQWSRITKKFDPEGKFAAQFHQFLNA